ncbi:MAG: bifunctional hydroxymethylpyrimidine kinase/phosphomethylpyrimidine kinase [Bacteroidales bacterium]|nr:bifunctional hydroxymethylpyrimidine kinase/phosphomethylpyrimidine kinase [Bacteroidales bacterium]
MKILVIGSSTTEMIFQAPVIPGKDETVMGTSFSMSPGGRGVNQAIAAARAGGEVVFICRTGNDLFGEQVIQVLQQNNIDTKNVRRDQHLASGISSVIVDSAGNSGITITQGANVNLSEKDLMNAQLAITPGDILLLQLDIPVETIRFAADLARSSGARVILNPAPALPVSDELLKSISILTPNASQAEILTGITITDERSAELAGRILLERGLNRVIITLRSKGAMVIDNGGAEHVPGFEMSSVDTSVVSDVFNGSLVVALSEGKNFYEAVLFANAAASLSASRPGALSSIPAREEILELVKTGKRVY